MTEEPSSEDRTILTAFEALERGPDEPAVPGEDGEAAETLARLYTEVLGLVPCELEPAAPRPEVKTRLLAAVRGEAAADETLPGLIGDGTQEVEPRPAPQRSAPIPREREMLAAPRVAMVSRRRSVWPMALAASLILALGGLCGWLLLRQTRMEETIALMTTPAVTVHPLRPVGEQTQARGILYVAPDHQHWYLAVHDLPPAAPDRDYQLWWVTGQGNVPAMTFEARSGEKVELGSETMPADTRDVMITLEPEGGTRSDTPTGPEILRAAGVYQL